LWGSFMNNFCTNCGVELDVTDNFCGTCGQRVKKNNDNQNVHPTITTTLKVPRFTESELDLSIESKLKFSELLHVIANKLAEYRDYPNKDGLGRVERPVGYYQSLKKDLNQLSDLIAFISPKDTVNIDSYKKIINNLEEFITDNIFVNGPKTINNYRNVRDFIDSDLLYFPNLYLSDPFSFHNDKSIMPRVNDFFDELGVALRAHKINAELIDSPENRVNYNQYVDFLIYSLEVSKMDLLVSAVNREFSRLAEKEGVYNTDQTPDEMVNRWEANGIDTSGCESSFTELYTLIVDYLKPLVINTREYSNYEISINSILTQSIVDYGISEHISKTVNGIAENGDFEDMHYCIYWADGVINGYFLSKTPILESDFLSKLRFRSVGDYILGIEFDGDVQDFDSGETERYHEIDAGVVKMQNFDLDALITGEE
jgi:hypothetical protein